MENFLEEDKIEGKESGQDSFLESQVKDSNVLRQDISFVVGRKKSEKDFIDVF